MDEFVPRIDGDRTVTLPKGEAGDRIGLEHRAGGQGRLTVGLGIEVPPGGSVELRWSPNPAPSRLERALIFLKLRTPTPAGEWVEVDADGKEVARLEPEGRHERHVRGRWSCPDRQD